MKFLPVFFFALLTLFTLDSALSAEVPARPVKGLFWEIGDGTNRIYLLGSIHVASKEMYPIDPIIEERFKACSDLLVEVDAEDPALLARLMPLIRDTWFYKAPDKLKNHVSPALYHAFFDAGLKLGIPAAQISAYRENILPSVLIMNYTVSNGYAEPGIDSYFLNKAKASGKKVIALESADMQVRMLSDLDNGNDLPEFSTNFSEFTNSTATWLKETVENWLSSDTNAIYQNTILPMETNTNLAHTLHTLFRDRDLPMAEKIVGHLKTGIPSFVIVGSGHFLGAGGIIDLLEKKGLNVTKY